MKKTEILSYTELTAHLNQLKFQREVQKASIKYTFYDFIANFNILSLLKNSNTSSSLESSDLIKNSIGIVLNLVTASILGKHRSLKDFLSTLMVQGFTKKLIDNDFISIISNLATHIFRNSNHHKTQA